MTKQHTGAILGVVAIASGVVGCTTLREQLFTQPLQSPTVVPAPKTSNTSSLSAMEQSVHELVNQYRATKNLPPLKLDARISEKCREHSSAMANGSVPFSHNGFEERVKAIEKTLPYRAAAENVAYNFGYKDPGKQAVEGWIKSEGHRKNMEGDYELTGMGIVKNAKGEYYFTQIFIRRR